MFMFVLNWIMPWCAHVSTLMSCGQKGRGMLKFASYNSVKGHDKLLLCSIEPGVEVEVTIADI